jgi:hypothetical protein
MLYATSSTNTHSFYKVFSNNRIRAHFSYPSEQLTSLGRYNTKKYATIRIISAAVAINAMVSDFSTGKLSGLLLRLLGVASNNIV